MGQWGEAWMSCSYVLSHEAYCKIVLHTLKFPHATVSGVLLGRMCVLLPDASGALRPVCCPLVLASLVLASPTQATPTSSSWPGLLLQEWHGGRDRGRAAFVPHTVRRCIPAPGSLHTGGRARQNSRLRSVRVLHGERARGRYRARQLRQGGGSQGGGEL